MYKNIKEAPYLNVEGLHRDLGRVMVVAPHPDDESLACGGLIAYLTSQGAKVSILFMTNGEASHPNSKNYPPQLLGDLRKKEALKACEILGVAKSEVIFLNAGDGKLFSFVEEGAAVYGKLKDILEKTHFDTLFVPWRRDHHIDHIATNKIIRKAAQGLDLIIAEYPVWLWKKGSQEDWPVPDEILPFRLNIEGVKPKKMEAIYSHRSQLTNLIDDDPDGFVFTEDLLKPFLDDNEYYFFPQEEKPPVKKEYFDELFSKDNDPWNFETSRYEQKKYQKTLDALPERDYKNALEIGCANGVFTNLLAERCNQVLALEHNANALDAARKRAGDRQNCRFLKWDISKGLPEENFDLVVLSEVGYYFKKDQLLEIYRDIEEALLPGGIFIMVHWTSYVREYPLTGLQVHELFENEYSKKFKKLNAHREELYDLVVWEKLAK
ncbi:bifunctional PIG-L family deacetylase/class I SAM-dependent methyltransferase [Christiangramia aquimixticola]|uniref:bifunctional PIG-L family deacetylase/class I SAM-dependent methyltransferase n=1 Tax=Christiangramia aquimixticola TaxID=1697558 RepID=UPI003AA99FC7